MIARAYVNHGRWVADCPRQYCANARELSNTQKRYFCGSENEGGCQLNCPIEWPKEAEQIDKVLKRRPVPMTRNWFPKDHDLAVRAGCPHGQTVADLMAENEVYGVK